MAGCLHGAIGTHAHLPEGTAMALTRRTLFKVSALPGLGVAGVTVLPSLAHANPKIVDPFTGRYEVSGTWNDHMSYSQGGIDFKMGVGTSLPACMAGTVEHIPDNGTGGRTIVIRDGSGWSSWYLHLSGYVAANGSKVKIGDTIAKSGGARGADGAGSSTGPHLHWHLVNPSGQRVDPQKYASGSGGSGKIAKTATSTDGVPGTIFWQRLQVFARIHGGYSGPIDGRLGTDSWKGVQKPMRNYGYTGPIDGKPGVNTYKAMQRLAQQKSTYRGPIDGTMGVNSWKAWGLFLNQDKYDK